MGGSVAVSMWGFGFAGSWRLANKDSLSKSRIH